MIITCEQCHTRFHLEDERLPARGARVRCSKCKHAFFVAHPAASRKAALEDAALAAAGVAAAAETDLDPGSAPTAGGARARGSGPAAPEEPRDGAPSSRPREDEGSWEFDDETGVRPAGGLPPSRDPLDEFLDRRDPLGGDSPGLDDLGPPESWDFVEDDADTGPIRDPVTDTGSGVFGTAGELLRGEDTEGLASASEPEAVEEDTAPLPVLAIAEDTGGFIDSEPSGVELAEPRIPPPASTAARPAPEQPEALEGGEAPTPRGSEPVASGEASGDASAPPDPAVRDALRVPRREREGPHTAPDRAQPEPGLADVLESLVPSRPAPRSVVGWAAAAGLLVAALTGALRPLPAPPAEVALAGGLRAEEIRVRRVPHLSGAELLVVSGRLVNGGAAARALGALLEVRLLDAGGSPLGLPPAPAGVALGEETLREGELSGLVNGAAARARELGRRSLAPGEAVRFDAVFPAVHERAGRFDLRVVRETAPRGAAGGGRAEDAGGDPAGPGAAAAGGSSRP